MFKRIVFVLPLLLLVAGCSDDGVDPAANLSHDPGVVTGEIGPGSDSFSFTIATAGDPADPIQGPFVLSGTNIHYDDALGALVADLTIRNAGRVAHHEPITLTFVDLLPEGVTVLNPDNDENGPGAMIVFEFENDDAMWTPGEKSFPRAVQFGVDPETSIGFIAQLGIGERPDRGTIGGIVWHDLNRNGERDDDESGIPGMIVTMERNDGPEMSMQPEILWRTETDREGRYAFDNLDPGSYVVHKNQGPGEIPTTSTVIYVLLTETSDGVSDFLEANFGCLLRDDTGPLHIGDYAEARGHFVNDPAFLGLLARELKVEHCEDVEVCIPEDCPCLDRSGRLRGRVTRKDAASRILYVMDTPIMFPVPDSAVASVKSPLRFEDVKVGDRVDVHAMRMGNLTHPWALSMDTWEMELDEVLGRVEWVQWHEGRIIGYRVLGALVTILEITSDRP